MKKFILSLFFVIFALFNVCGEDVIILPKIEKKFVDYNAQNPLKSTNVEGIFVINPYKGEEAHINNKGYRIFVLDKNSKELLYIIENIVLDWHPNHNNGWGGRVIKDDFLCLTKECVEYVIKGDKFNCEVHSYLEGKYLTEDGEDLLHPIIRNDIDEDIRKIEQALVDYVFYPELVERGFDVHHLDNMKIDGEMFEYIESFFRPNIEKGWPPLDNHHLLNITDENRNWYQSYTYHKWVKFSNEYGTKDELLKKGYAENETMFYYPSNGEKDWRVGEWTWFNWKGDDWKDGNSAPKLEFKGMEETSEDIFVLETKKSYVVKIDGLIANDSFDKISFPKKEYLIIDLLNGEGGKVNPALAFAEKIKKSKYKKIIVLIDDASSAAERLVYALKDDKRVIYIGENTNGLLEGINPKPILYEKNKISLKLSTEDFIPDSTFLEGVGYIPDIWAQNTLDIMKNLWRITEDYGLITNDGEVHRALKN